MDRTADGLIERTMDRSFGSEDKVAAARQRLTVGSAVKQSVTIADEIQGNDTMRWGFVLLNHYKQNTNTCEPVFVRMVN